MKKYLVYAAITILIGYILLVIALCIPNELLLNNVRKSAVILYSQGDYPELYLDDAFIEGFTDSDYVAVAYNIRTDNPFYNALDAFNYCYSNRGYDRGSCALYSSFFDNPKKIYEHSHAWHGYRIFLRPLFIRYTVTDIRFIMTSVCMILIVLICIYIVLITGSVIKCAPFLLSLLFYNFQIITLSISVSLNTILALVPASIILKGILERKSTSYFRMCMYFTGLLSAYFALCCLPVLSIGYPIILFITYEDKINDKLRETFVLIGVWAAGYAAEGLPKFLVNEIFFKRKGLSYSAGWYLGVSTKVDFYERIVNASDFLSRVFLDNGIKTDILVIICLVTLVIAIVKRVRHEGDSIDFHILVAYAFIGIIPFIWVMSMVVASGISFTIFIFSVSIFALLQCLWNIAFS